MKLSALQNTFLLLTLFSNYFSVHSATRLYTHSRNLSFLSFYSQPCPANSQHSVSEQINESIITRPMHIQPKWANMPLGIRIIPRHLKIYMSKKLRTVLLHVRNAKSPFLRLGQYAQHDKETVQTTFSRNPASSFIGLSNQYLHQMTFLSYSLISYEMGQLRQLNAMIINLRVIIRCQLY